MSTIIHAIVGYFFLLLTVRVLTRRPGAQMTMFEFVIIFLIGGVIILSTVANDRSITNCTCAIITVGLLHSLVSWAKLKWPRIGAIVDGTPLVVMAHGQWREEVMHGMRLDENDIMASARGQGLRTLDEVEYAVLERNGDQHHTEAVVTRCESGSAAASRSLRATSQQPRCRSSSLRRLPAA